MPVGAHHGTKVDTYLTGHESCKVKRQREAAQKDLRLVDGHRRRASGRRETRRYRRQCGAQAGGVDHNAFATVNRVGRGHQLIGLGTKNGWNTALRSSHAVAEDAGGGRDNGQVEIIAGTARRLQHHGGRTVHLERQLRVDLLRGSQQHGHRYAIHDQAGFSEDGRHRNLAGGNIYGTQPASPNGDQPARCDAV
jgi:hypothetical protein